MMILSIISINVPGLVQIVQQILLNFIYMDLFQTDKWVIPLFYTEDQLAMDEPLNMFFDLNGLGSPRFIVTTGSSFVFLVIFISEHLLYIISRDFLSRFTVWGKRIADKLSTKLHWAGTVRFIMQQFAPLLLASVMNLFKVIPKILIFYSLSFQMLEITSTYNALQLFQFLHHTSYQNSLLYSTKQRLRVPLKMKHSLLNMRIQQTDSTSLQLQDYIGIFQYSSAGSLLLQLSFF
ncbi:hypothetical protein FGO68_gene13443 [Halteria grandinella]|uniref:Uncharacterized protein n=1 Tax=Halteria grandinella TaxID=5974 RepID=A0A8J8TAG4_HALGN|nr:hypothetical protein FGO68_gene13443 [Halteria grandinella]